MEDIEDVLPEGAVYEGNVAKIEVPPDMDPRDYMESIKEQEEEVDPAEAKRLANWKANFLYKPITDPDVVITQEMLEDGGRTLVLRNHMRLRSFFESEGRFTPQFKQLYSILE